MTPSRKKLITSSVLLLGVGVVVVAGITLYPSLRERYWIWRLESETEEQRLEAAERLGELGSRRAAHVLVELLEDKRLGRAVRASLINLGETAIPALSRGVNSKSAMLSLLSARTLVELMSQHPLPVPTLTRIMGLKHENLRIAAADALARSSDSSTTVVTSLLRSMDGSSPAMRCHAIRALGEVAATSDLLEEVKAMLDALGDPRLFEAASQALRTIRSRRRSLR